MHRPSAFLIAGLLTLLLTASCATRTAAHDDAGVNAALDAWHKAASVADEERYFALMTDTAVFLGTDASERWDVAAFRAYAHPHFSAGNGWTFVPRGRHVAFSPAGDVAWFDEALDSASYGECRGSGVLERHGGSWKIAHYNLTIPIPNDLAKKFVEEIRSAKSTAP